MTAHAGFMTAHDGFMTVHDLIFVDVGDLGCRVLNLRNESNIHTNGQRIPRMSRDPIGSNKAGHFFQLFKFRFQQVYFVIIVKKKGELIQANFHILKQISMKYYNATWFLNF